MLMNQKLGQRMADECMSPEQYVVAEAIKKALRRAFLTPQRQQIRTLKTQHFLARPGGQGSARSPPFRNVTERSMLPTVTIVAERVLASCRCPDAAAAELIEPIKNPPAGEEAFHALIR